MLLCTLSVRSQTTHPLVDSLIKKTLDTYKMPSIVVAYIEPDTTIYGIYGKVNIDSTISVKLTSKYHLGSNTKAITSFIAFQMIEDGKITLETKFLDLLPELKSTLRDVYWDMTLSDLLSHTAKVRAYTSGKEHKSLPKIVGSPAEKRLLFAKYVLSQKPVETGTYSNAGYILAALMIEKASNQDFETIVKKTLTSLHLQYSLSFPNKEDINHPWGHWMEKKKLKALPPEHSYMLTDYYLSAGDVSMNILDYSAFIRMHLKGILGQDTNLSKESYEQLFYAKKEYGYGWGNQINEKGKLAFHDGTAGTFYCSTLISSTSEFAVILIMNSATEKHTEGLMDLRNEIFKIRKKLR